MDMNFLIDREPDLPERLHKDLSDFIPQKIEYGVDVEEFLRHMDVFAKYSAETNSKQNGRLHIKKLSNNWL